MGYQRVQHENHLFQLHMAHLGSGADDTSDDTESSEQRVLAERSSGIALKGVSNRLCRVSTSITIFVARSTHRIQIVRPGKDKHTKEEQSSSFGTELG